MKDKQIRSKPEDSHIPIVSSVLHLVAMPVIVFLRRNFGYTFLRPKSIFLALCWATFLLTIYAWNEPEVWGRWRAVCFFSGAAAVLYVRHLLRAVVSQFGDAEHDHYSGKSWLSFFHPEPFKVHLVFEPLFVAAVAALLRFQIHEPRLANVLFVAAFALFCKELINSWNRVRKIKRQADALVDATDTMEEAYGQQFGAEVKERPKAVSRKARVRRDRAAPGPEGLSEMERHAQVLRLIPPYTLEQANSNYRRLVRQFHPDNAGESAEAQTHTRQLAESIKFFRRHFQV